MPGLPILHSRDLVNWRVVGYSVDRLDLGPAFRPEEKGGLPAGHLGASFRYPNGIYAIFANVNRFGLQVFRQAETFQSVGLQRADTLLMSLARQTTLWLRESAGRSLRIIPDPRRTGRAAPASKWRVVR